MRKFIPVLLLIPAAIAAAQVSTRPAPPGGQTTAATSAAAPAPAAATPAVLVAIPDLEPILAQVEQVSQATRLDLEQTRIEKWKIDSSNRRELLSNADLIERNLSGTMPGMLAAVRSTPQALAANFRLYQNLNALNDVLGRLAEYAGAYGPKSEFEPLARDTSNLDSVRRALGDRLYALAQSNDGELARMRALLAASKATPAPPVRKVVVDDEAPAAKPSSKKKKSPPKASSSSPSSSQTTPTPH